MLELYLVLMVAGSQPQIQTFKDIQDACAVIEAQPGAKLYKETVDHRETVTIVEGQCKPVKQFFQVK